MFFFPVYFVMNSEIMVVWGHPVSISTTYDFSGQKRALVKSEIVLIRVKKIHFLLLDNGMRLSSLFNAC